MEINWNNLFHSAKRPKNYASAMGIALAFAVALGLYAFRGVIWPAHQAAPTVETAAAAVPFRHPLTGAPSETEVALPQVEAVMIDHSVDAWPQSGVDQAFLVIEAPVEASIPRLQAYFYDGQNVPKIGPVRSARPYFVDWAHQFEALYAHVGGSDAALKLIASSNTFDLNEFGHGLSFWRASDRLAPHNAYTSSVRLHDAIADATDAPKPAYGVWKFKDAETKVEKGQGITVDFSAPQYKAVWTHDADTNSYTRKQGTQSYAMQDGAKIAAKNVAVMVTDVKVLDAVGRKEVRTKGEGEAWVLQDGKVIHGKWKMPDVGDRIRFYDESDKEITMNAGQTWIEVAESASRVTVTEAK